MSTIKSSDEHLTLNADGSSKDIKFQANGVEKASISSSGAFTSTTIDATKLTGNLPAINGASLTGLPQSFTGAVTATTDMVVQATSSSRKMFMGVSSDDLAIGNYSNSNATRNEHLKITSDGRGLSQFTAKVWGILDGNTNNIKDSHNVSSITDHGAGDYTFNFTNNLGSSTFCTTSSFSRTHWDNFVSIYGGHQTAGSVRVTHNRTSTSGGIDTDQLCIQVFGD